MASLNKGRKAGPSAVPRAIRSRDPSLTQEPSPTDGSDPAEKLPEGLRPGRPLSNVPGTGTRRDLKDTQDGDEEPVDPPRPVRRRGSRTVLPPPIHPPVMPRRSLSTLRREQERGGRIRRATIRSSVGLLIGGLIIWLLGSWMSADPVLPCDGWRYPREAVPCGQAHNMTRLFVPLAAVLSKAWKGGLIALEAPHHRQLDGTFDHFQQRLDIIQKQIRILQSQHQTYSDRATEFWQSFNLHTPAELAMADVKMTIDLDSCQPSSGDDYWQRLRREVSCMLLLWTTSVEERLIGRFTYLTQTCQQRLRDFERVLRSLEKYQHSTLPALPNDLYSLLEDIALDFDTTSWRKRKVKLEGIMPMLQDFRQVESRYLELDAARHVFAHLLGAADAFVSHLQHQALQGMAVLHDVELHKGDGEALAKYVVEDAIRQRNFTELHRLARFAHIWESGIQLLPSKILSQVAKTATWHHALKRFHHCLKSDSEGELEIRPRHDKTYVAVPTLDFREYLERAWRNIGFAKATCTLHSSPFMRWYYDEWEQSAVLAADVSTSSNVFEERAPKFLDVTREPAEERQWRVEVRQECWRMEDLLPGMGEIDLYCIGGHTLSHSDTK